MRPRTATLVIAVAFTMGAITATASAALPEFAPVSGTFKGESKVGSKVITKFKGTIECSSYTDAGELKSAKEGVFTMDFAGCEVFGVVGARSLGDKEGTVLVHGTTSLCYVNKATKEAGFALHPETVHVEVAGKLITVIGWVIGRARPVNTSTKSFTATFQQKGGESGVQEIKRCEGGQEETLLLSEGTGPFEETAFVSEMPFAFLASHEILA
jgi:hypothetical protein